MNNTKQCTKCHNEFHSDDSSKTCDSCRTRQRGYYQNRNAKREVSQISPEDFNRMINALYSISTHLKDGFDSLESEVSKIRQALSM